MRRQARTAPAARIAARTCPIPGRRGRPEISKGSNSKPASGTSLASNRAGDPANVTTAPRARSASATASAGSTCPAVPPVAIRHTGRASAIVAGDVKEDPDGGEPHNEARAAVGDERQRDPRERRGAHDGREIDQRLPADEGCDP